MKKSGGIKYAKPKWKTYPQLRRTLKKEFARYIVKSRKGCEFHDLIKQAGLTAPTRCNDTFCCFHIIPVGQTRGLEFDERNVLRACTGSNSWERVYRDVWMNDIAPKILGQRFKMLDDARRVVTKRNTSDLQMMILHYQQENGKLS